MHSVLHYYAAYTLGPALPSTGSYYPSVSMRLIYGGTGISTSYPSPTTIVLGLGPDLPWADEPSPGNLGLSTCKFLAYISLLIPAFSLLYRPQVLPVLLQPVHYAPLPLSCMSTVLSRSQCLSPGNICRISSINRTRLKSGRCNSLHLFPEYSTHTAEPEASVVCLAPLHLRRTITRPVSYYALFE